MTIQGFVKSRKRQWAYQGSNSSLIDTAVAATRIVPYRGVPTVNPNWTFEDVDDGTLIGVQAPSMRRWDITSPPAGPVAYDDLPHVFSASLHGGVTASGGGTAKTWAFQPDFTNIASTPLGMLTEEYGDDVGDPSGETPADWFQLVGGVFETIRLAGVVGEGPLQLTSTLRFAKAASTGSTDYPVSGSVPAALTIDASPVWVYPDDLEVFIDDAYGSIGTTKITDAVHSIDWQVTNAFDLKSFANGSNTRFQIRGYGRGMVSSSLALEFAKTSQTVGLLSEADDWLSKEPVKRFIELRFTSPELAQASVPHSLVARLAGWYTTREDGARGGNTVVTLNHVVKHDADLGYALRAVVVNTLASI